MLHIPSFLAPVRLDAARVEILSQSSLPILEIEGYIVSRASHKAVTSNACRGKKLPAEWQADSKISNIISDFMSQRISGGVGGALSDGCPYPYRRLPGLGYHNSVD